MLPALLILFIFTDVALLYCISLFSNAIQSTLILSRNKINFIQQVCCQINAKTLLPLLLCASACLVCIFSFAQPKPTPASERINGLQKRKLLEEKSLVKNLQYRNIGPTNMSGRVVDVDVNPADPTEFYVAYATGGLWHTTTNGQSFTPIFDKEDATGIGDIAVSWTTLSTSEYPRTIWVGTGEANSSRSSYSGLGVYKSSDNGKTWQYMGLPESHHIGKIIIHPTIPDIAWVAVLGHLYSANKERGVYKTTDGGKSWKQTLFVDDNTGAVDMDMNPKNPDELYAGMWYRTRRAWNFEESGKTSGIYKSTDGGNTWKPVTLSGSGFPNNAGVGRIGVAVFAGNPNIVYATVDNQNHRPDTAVKKTDTTKYVLKDFKNITAVEFEKLNDKRLDTFLMNSGFPEKYRSASVKEMVRSGKVKPTAVYDYLNDANNALFDTPIIGCEVYRSDDAGATWKKVNKKGLDLYNTYGYYFGKISVAPSDENKIVISGFSLSYSSDGGKTFKATDKSNTHADWHGCWINPNRPGHWVAGNDGGCNITYDYGKHWFKANSPSVGQFYAITVDEAKPYNVYGGLQDNGTWFGPSKLATRGNEDEDDEDSEKPDPHDLPARYIWKGLGGGDGMQVQVDTRDNKTVYAGFQFGFYGRRNTEGGRPVSIHPMHDLGEDKLRYNWQTPIWLSKHGPDVFYYATNKFHRSLNRGEKMETISSDLTNGKKEGDVPFGSSTTISESPLKFGLLYVGTDDGNVQISKDGGYTWNKLTIAPAGSKTVFANYYVSRVTASMYKESRVYVTLNGYRNDNFEALLFVSEDYGTTWQQLGTDLPAEPLNVVREDAKKENIIYVGSDAGVYASFDKGKSFMSLSHNLPRVPVHDLVIQTRENDLVVGTHGRSIYIANLAEVHKAYGKMVSGGSK